MNETKEIIGVIDRYNKSDGKLPGIQVDGKWYNADKDLVQEFEAMKDKIGFCVKMQLSNGKFIKKIEVIQDKPKLSEYKQFGSYQDERQEVIIREWAFGQALTAIIAKGYNGSVSDMLKESGNYADDIIIPWLKKESVREEEI